MRVLIAVDESDSSSLAVESVTSRLWPEDTEFRIINVIEPIYHDGAFANIDIPSIGDLPSILEAQEQYCNHCIELVIAKKRQIKERHPSNEIDHIVANGYVAETIIKEATEWGADLIVLGSHGRKGIQKFLLGSVAERVAIHSPCSVEIVKQKEQSAKSCNKKEKTART